MNSKTIAPNYLFSKMRSIYHAIVSFFDFDPTETIRAQIRERNPNLEKQEIDRSRYAESFTIGQRQGMEREA